MAQQALAMFVADSVGLDFLNSIATPVDVPVDWIDDGLGLLTWLREARLVPGEVLEEFRRSAMPGELDAVAAQARALREWFRSFVQERMGAPLSSRHLTALEPLNRLLARDQSYLKIVARRGEDGDPARKIVLAPERRWSSPESLLQPIGEVLARLVSEEDFTQVKACEGANCTLLFADHTKGHRRRWCSMAVCGNRAKQQAHYQRKHARD
jgi:predicted RNA-binding Zn ribbon-like protein